MTLCQDAEQLAIQAEAWRNIYATSGIELADWE
jgi:hypothetical protein